MALRRRPRWRLALVLLAAPVLVVAALMVMLWHQQAQADVRQPERGAQYALVLGNRAYVDGQVNPCLSSRVERGVELARQGLVSGMLMSGGVDQEDGRIEADVMAATARAAGYGGPLLLEPRSESTRENLLLSRPILQAAGVRSVIVVSDARHLWRVRLLARASGFEQDLDVQYVASPTECSPSVWRRWKAALREPLAIVNNALHGYL
ncbi:YdcF family protein [Variovorax dokdonensis]|uniref:YdcF family protein n=1 Tax=Variovorax dokdonensis TaxID=344883 RepID=A0ABT7NBD1_9BURK|nr:YdcF family protein [Variovorax dokdonensis]MDM0045233.1 YdcF family protein [Variovorax dokdonensis]